MPIDGEPLHRVTRVAALERVFEPYLCMAASADQLHISLLENPGDPSHLGRYSFFCADAFWVYRSKRRSCFSGPPGRVEAVAGDPLEVLGTLLRRYSSSDAQVWRPGLPPLLGGAVGYLGYELLYLIENIPDTGLDDLALPDSYLVFYGTVLATDAIERKTWLISTAFAGDPRSAEAEVDRLQREALGRLERLDDSAKPEIRARLRDRRGEILRARPRLSEQHLRDLGFKTALNGSDYMGVVDQAKRHIYEGDVFEVCTTNRFDTTYQGSGSELFHALRNVNPAPFASWLRFPEVEVLCSSPERFISVDRAGWAEARPIKGTRPRGRTAEEDAALKADLSSNIKDRAENIMIVDLERNDLGRVSEFGTVRVPELTIVESYAFVHQLISTVRGKLRRSCTPIDLIRATFPGGSMTGAPKVEALKIIDRLEPVKRGIFSGAIGYFDYDGAIDLNIVIRTFVKKGDRLSFHVGGAIVIDSDPAGEYQEILDKAHGLVTALQIANEARANGGER